jgi:hypothetical protein
LIAVIEHPIMHIRFFVPSIVLGCLILTEASPVVPVSRTPSSSLTPTLLHQFPNGTWVENILTLQSGELLVTLLNSAQVMLIDPQSPASASKLQIVNQVVSQTAVLGIAQPDPHKVAVVAGNLSYPGQISIPGSYGVQLYDLDTDDQGSSTLAPNRWFPIPDAGELDGMTAIPGNPNYLLMADPSLGLIWRLDLRNGSFVSVFGDSEGDQVLLGKIPGVPTAGVNGIHAQDGYVYFTNSNRASFGRIPITDDGLSTGEPGEVLVTDFPNTTYDDFALGNGSYFFLCSPTGHSINLAFLNGTQQVLAGGSDDVKFDHPVAAMLGKTQADSDTLYVATAGIIEGVGGVGGGQIFAIDGVTP